MDSAQSADAMLRPDGTLKEFPGVRALDQVDLEVKQREVHCLVGHDGAGKSTLIKMLSRAHRPDAGRLTWLGDDVPLAHLRAAMRAGIPAIYQALDLVEGLSVADNVFLGAEPRRLGFVQRGQMRPAAREVLAWLWHGETPVQREVAKLPSATKQIVSMAGALSKHAQLLIMDVLHRS
jgi:ribose transport system ATP-binding protein